MNDSRFKIPRLRTEKLQFEVGQILTIRLTGAGSEGRCQTFRLRWHQSVWVAVEDQG